MCKGKETTKYIRCFSLDVCSVARVAQHRNYNMSKEMAGHHSIAFQSMNEQRKNGELCDFKIEVEGKTIQVHRVALASCSEYFRKMFNSPMRESYEGVCQLKDTTAKVAEICVNFMYTGEMDITPDIAVKVSKLSHMWQLDKAVDICVKVMSQNLASTNCISILKIGKFYSIQTLADNCIRYILSNISSMVKEVEDLDCSDMQEILKACDSEEGRTSCDATELGNFCLEWGASLHYSSQFCAIVNLFPVERLSYAHFFGNVWENSHFRGCENCRQNAGKRYINSKPTTTVENCLFLKHLVNYYGGGPNTLTDFIVNRSEAVFATSNFAKVTTEENLMDYITRLGRNKKRCSRAEFAGIIAWFKFDSTRKKTFKKIFLLQFEDCDNEFLVSVNTFDERIATVRDALFIMKLFDEHSSTGWAWSSAINVTTEKFREAAKLPQFSDVTSQNLKVCMRNLNFHRVDENEIWDGIIKWVNFDPDQRKTKFPDIFAEIELEKFSSEFLRQTVCMSELVIENRSCISRLLEFMFEKFENQDARISKLEKRIMKA